jgi:hypothetical protein
LIASTYPKKYRKEYTEAAERVRLPVWDYASSLAGEYGYPSFLTKDTLTIHRTASGDTNVEIQNPFQSYTFPIRTSASPDVTLNVSDPGINPKTYLAGQHTVRYPIGNSTFIETQTSDYNAANEKLKEVIPTCVQTRVHALLSAPEGSSTYQCFLNGNMPIVKSCSSEERNIALDRIHSYAHEMMAGSPWVGHPYVGTISNTAPYGNPTQAHDPAFHILHVSMDMHHAIWQRLNPETKLRAALDIPPPGFIYTRLGGGMVSNETDLTPFWKDFRFSNKYLNSNDVWNHRDLGYEYETLEESGSNKAKLREAVNALYGGSGNTIKDCKYDLGYGFV